MRESMAKNAKALKISRIKINEIKRFSDKRLIPPL